MLARCKFGVDPLGRCGATITYPIKGYPWRRNVVKSFQFSLSEQEKDLLFAEVPRLRAEHSEDCLTNGQLWSDASETANGITRDRRTGTLCLTIGIIQDNGEWIEQFSMRENSEALLASPLYKIISRLIEPYEKQDRRAQSA